MRSDEEVFVDVPIEPKFRRLLQDLLPVRRDLLVDPLLNDPWSCSPHRCRPLLGRNLCCKVEARCRYLRQGLCAIHDDKPLDCALFPIDLIRVDGIRVVTTVKNMNFFDTGWSRFDRDMLRCFEGTERGDRSMFEAQEPVLSHLFTVSEMHLLRAALAETPEGRE